MIDKTIVLEHEVVALLKPETIRTYYYYVTKKEAKMILSNYEPKRVLHHFETISQIPRGSGNEKAVSDYIANFAKGLGLDCVQDARNNLIITKPGTQGYENNDPIILQGHLDMVCEKNAGTVHDFTKDPIKLYVDGDFIKAKGTTLGADNGIAVALCMALLESGDLSHPPLEVVLTTDEETGMSGAYNLDASTLKGRKMINLDAGRQGGFTAGSAAGITAEYELPAMWEPLGTRTQAYTVTVKGLVGGHSGGDITKERGNAIRILGILLNAMDEVADIRITSIEGGMKVNAIPREANAVIVVDPANEAKLQEAFDKCKPMLKEFFRVADPGLDVALLPVSATASEAEMTNPQRVVGNKALIPSLLLMPSGVQCMSRDIDGLVAASCNMGVLEVCDDMIKISCMPRGASDEHAILVEKKIDALAKLAGANARFIQRSPAWAFNPESKILKMVVAHYEAKHNHKPEITAIHGGLECGLFIEKIKGLDIVAFGPNMYDLHTPDERLSISSTKWMWGFLCEVLAKL